jgi:hypothetical protein
MSSGTSTIRRALRAIDGWWRAEAPATRLAGLRLLVGGFATIYLAARVVHLISFVDFPASGFAPVGVVSLLSAPLPAALVIAPVLLALPLAALFTLGWRFAATGPAFAAVLLWVLSYRNSWGMVFHTENLLVLHVMVLGLARSADAWSLDVRRAAPSPSGPAHGWPVRLLAVVTLATYVLAGVAKLRLSGLAWVDSDLLRNYIAYDNLRKLELGDWHSPLGGALVGQAWLFPPLAGLSLALELLAPLALLGGRVAVVWALAAWAFHVGVLAVMAIFFPYPLFGLAFAPLFPVERLPLWRWLGLAAPELRPA